MKNSLTTNTAAVALALAASLPVYAGGSNYAITPGTLANVTGKVSEWPVPTPRFARDPAPGPDGNIYITVMNGNKVARFDTKTHAFKEWELAAGQIVRSISRRCSNHRPTRSFHCRSRLPSEWIADRAHW